MVICSASAQGCLHGAGVAVVLLACPPVQITVGIKSPWDADLPVLGI